MARSHPRCSTSSPPLLLHAAWLTALVAVCLALCTIHARNRRAKPSSSSSSRRGLRFPSSSSSRRGGSGSSECNGGGGGGTAASAAAAKVSPTPSDTAKQANGAEPATQAAAPEQGGDGPVTVIDVGSHGPIAPTTAFLPPPPDPIPPRRSLSMKHIRFAERLGRIRSMRRASGDQAAPADDDVFVGCRGDAAPGGDVTLWTKTIILGERCRVPSGGGSDEDDVDGDGVMLPWKTYRPRQPRSVPVTRSNSFAGVGSAGAYRRPDARF